MNEINFEPVSSEVLGAAVEVHKALGPGLLESAYEECLVYELASRTIQCARQVPINIDYKEKTVECGFRADLIVDDQVIVEIKAVEKLIPLFDAQLLTYLKLTGLKIGLLINFNVPLLKQGIKRIVN